MADPYSRTKFKNSIIDETEYLRVFDDEISSLFKLVI